MYQRCVTSTGQPEFMTPSCDKQSGSGIGAGWKPGEGRKGSGGAPPHPPPERQKSLNLRLEKVRPSIHGLIIVAIFQCVSRKEGPKQQVRSNSICPNQHKYVKKRPNQVVQSNK